MKYKFLFLVWLIGSFHIFYYGRYGNPYIERYKPEYIGEYPLKGVIFAFGLFSAYFIVSYLFKYTKIDRSYPIFTYFICTIIAVVQLVMAGLGAMHAPPYWVAFFYNVVMLILIQFILILTLFDFKAFITRMGKVMNRLMQKK